MRDNGRDKSRSPVAKNCSRSEWYRSGLVRLAASSCLHARNRKVTAFESRRLASRLETAILFLRSKSVSPSGVWTFRRDSKRLFRLRDCRDYLIWRLGETVA